MTMLTSQPKVVQSDAPMSLARELLELWETPKKRWGVMAWKGTFWEWHGGRWRNRTKEQVVSAVLLALEGAIQVGSDPLTVNSKMAEEVVRCIAAITEVPHERLPVWLERTEATTDPEYSIAFEDVVVDVGESAKQGKIMTVERDERLFGGVTVNCRWDAGAKCPLWEKCCEEWSEGDKEWVELLERYAGYCAMGTRKYARSLGQLGVNRGGKGIPVRLMERMLGKVAVKSRDLITFSGNFGLAGLPEARVLVLTEMNELENVKGEVVASRWKSILGGDGMTVDTKFQPMQEVTLRLAVIVQANEMPKLPNKGEGLMSKLLVLPYTRTFLGKENLELEEKLAEEMPGIARRWVEAAVRLEAEADPGKKWPKPRAAEGIIKEHLRSINQLEQFVEDRFIKEPSAKVTTQAVREAYVQWCEEMEVSPDVPMQQVVETLLEKIPWHLSRHRASADGPRMVKGMAFKRVVAQAE